MTNEFDAHSLSEAESLEDLLRDVTDENERARLEKAWHAFGDCAVKRYAAPPPSRELEMIFRKGSKGVDEQMSDDELEMLAAAGSVNPQVTDGVTFTPDGGSDGDSGEGNEHGTQSTNIVYGTDGDDSLIGHHNSDFMRGLGGDDTMEGRGGDDIMYGDAGHDSMNGGSGADRMYGGEGNDSMEGGSGNDILNGDHGDDTLIGDSGDDAIDGGEGADRIQGGAGNDLLTGGAGGDVFVFRYGDGDDVITDFNPETDRLEFPGVDQREIVTSADGHGNTVISFRGTTITLLGVDPNDNA